MCQVDYADPMEPYSRENRKARKEHKCSECGKVIKPGENYVYHTGKCEGDWLEFKHCEGCTWAAQWLTHVCNGFVFWQVLEDLEEHIRDFSVYEGGLGRRILGMRKKWKDNLLERAKKNSKSLEKVEYHVN